MNDHPFDAVIRLSENDINKIGPRIDERVKDAAKKKNISLVIGWAEDMIAVGQVAWMSMAHLVYETNKRWEEFGIDDDFSTFMGFHLNRSPQTINRMFEIWRFVFEVPKHSKQRFNMLLSKPPSGLWQIKQCAKEGLLTEDDWQDIELAPNKDALSEVRKRVRGIRGRGKDALKVMMEADGTLKARRKGRYENVGFLNVNMVNESPIIQQAIERIINSSGIFRR